MLTRKIFSYAICARFKEFEKLGLLATPISPAQASSCSVLYNDRAVIKYSGREASPCASRNIFKFKCRQVASCRERNRLLSKSADLQFCGVHLPCVRRLFAPARR